MDEQKFEVAEIIFGNSKIVMTCETYDMQLKTNGYKKRSLEYVIYIYKDLLQTCTD